MIHFLYIKICAIICIFFYIIFRNKSQKTKYIAVYIPVCLAFVVHFLKLLIPEYKNDLPQSLLSISPETLCAISTLTFPFIYISKSKKLKDYMLVFGIISGLATILLPVNIQGYAPFDIEVMRFYFAHLCILITPLFMYIFKIHKLEKGWVKNVLQILLIAIIIMLIDNFIFIYLTQGQIVFNN